MECDFTASVEVLNVAMPAELRATVVNVVVPSLKMTVPVGVPAPGATTLTVAVKVTDWFRVAGFAVRAKRGCRRSFVHHLGDGRAARRELAAVGRCDRMQTYAERGEPQ